MKIERILSILFYLLNRGRVSGNQLAKEFGVSRRTIIRDIDTLSLAGIPIYAETGVNGGYAIHQNFQLSGNLLTETNAQYLLLALTSLKTVYGDQKIDETYEKVAQFFSSESDQKLLELDFSVVGENKQVIEKVSQIKKAVVDQLSISFDYTSPASGRSRVTIDPLHVSYKWYAWYVYGYSHEKQAMRQYKLIRMRHLRTNQPWLQEYDIPQMIDQMEEEQHNDFVTLIIRYSNSIQVLVEEYLGGELLAEEAGYLTAKISMRENNFMLFSILLGFGDQLQVLEPQFFLEKLVSHLEKALINNSKR